MIDYNFHSLTLSEQLTEAHLVFRKCCSDLVERFSCLEFLKRLQTFRLLFTQYVADLSMDFCVEKKVQFSHQAAVTT